MYYAFIYHLVFGIAFSPQSYTLTQPWRKAMLYREGLSATKADLKEYSLYDSIYD